MLGALEVIEVMLMIIKYTELVERIHYIKVPDAEQLGLQTLDDIETAINKTDGEFGITAGARFKDWEIVRESEEVILEREGCAELPTLDFWDGTPVLRI